MTPDGAFCLLASCVLFSLSGFSAHFGVVYVAPGFAAAGVAHVNETRPRPYKTALAVMIVDDMNAPP